MTTNPTTPAAPRMSLSNVVSGKVRKPLRVLIHGVDGVGKTTFAAGAPKPIFLPTEEGANQIDVPKLPIAQSYEELRAAVRTLISDPHDYQTAVIDSLDWAEALVFRHVCERDKKTNIEDVGGGFGKGYSAAVDEWRQLIGALEELQAKRKMHLILIAHSGIKKFSNPEGEDYERYIIKMNEKSSGLWREWVDGVYFANFEILPKTDKRKRVRGVSTGARHLHTTREGAFDAKDRYGLPEKLPLAWEDFWAAYQKGEVSDPKEMLAEIQRKAKELGGEIEIAALKFAEENKAKPNELARMNTRLNAKLAEKKESMPEAPPAT